MSEPTRERARLLLAAIRVLAFREEAPPAPEAVAELLAQPPEMVRLEVTRLGELGILRLVRSAYATHLEVADEEGIAGLPERESGPALDDALADFQRRKQQEAERMHQLFQDGEHERRKRGKLQEMDEGLQSYRKRKPRNPFED